MGFSNKVVGAVYLKEDAGENIVLCDENGQVFDGQVSATVTNAVDELTTATVTFFVAGWKE